MVVMLRSVDTTSGQQHIGDTVDQGEVQASFQIITIQILQKTARLGFFQGSYIVLQIICDSVIGDVHKEPGKIQIIRHFTEAVFQCLSNSVLVRVRHLPKIDLATLTTIGIGNIEHIAQLVGNIPVNQQSNALGAFVDPSAKFVPHLDFRTGCGIRLLGVDQKLLLKAVLVVICGSVQERHEPFGVGGYAQGLLRRHFFYDL